MLLFAPFLQAHKLVLRGCVPASEETLQFLAALRLQSLNGDFSTHMPFPCLDQLFPPGLLHSRLGPLPSPPSHPKVIPAAYGFLAGALSAGLWGGSSLAKQQVEWKQQLHGRFREEAVSVIGAIMDKWKQLQGMGRLEAVAAYVELVGEWSAFSSAPFDVEAHLVSYPACISALPNIIVEMWRGGEWQSTGQNRNCTLLWM